MPGTGANCAGIDGNESTHSGGSAASDLSGVLSAESGSRFEAVAMISCVVESVVYCECPLPYSDVDVPDSCRGRDGR